VNLPVLHLFSPFWCYLSPRRECGNCVTGARRLPLDPLVFGTSSIRFSSRWTKTPVVLRGLRSTVRVWGSRIHRSDSRSGSRVLLLRAARTSPNETPSRPPMTRAMANCGPPPWRESQTELLRRRQTSVLLRKLRGQQLSSSRRRNGNNTPSNSQSNTLVRNLTKVPSNTQQHRDPCTLESCNYQDRSQSVQ
jgi:hypothetical protein